MSTAINDLINRQQAIELIENDKIGDDSPFISLPRAQVINRTCERHVDIIKNLPSAQKTGTWLHERIASTTGGTYPIVRCSGCMGDMPFEWTAKYCPHCGARME